MVELVDWQINFGISADLLAIPAEQKGGVADDTVLIDPAVDPWNDWTIWLSDPTWGPRRNFHGMISSGCPEQNRR